MNKWYQQTVQETLKTLNTSIDGLEEDEVKRRMETLGRNTLPSGKSASFVSIFINQFKSPLIYILLAASFISLFVQEYVDAVFISIVLLTNALLGTYQEWNAEKKAEALQKIVPHYAEVIRGGKRKRIEAENIVPGDIIVLQPGLKVPADMRVLQSQSLSIDESLLTGESLPVFKTTHPLKDLFIPLGDRTNIAFSNTVVSQGKGLGVVI